jgi:5-methylcytosine-specific restriction endonuclease McrA
MPRRDGYLREYQLRWIHARRAAWLAENGPCVRCGSTDQLEVDHRDRREKVMQTRALWSLAPTNPARIAELAKCQVLCHWLCLRIVGREHWADHRYGPVLAWQTAKIIHPKRRST